MSESVENVLIQGILRGGGATVRNRDLDESGSRFAVGMVGVCDFEGVVGGR